MLIQCRPSWDQPNYKVTWEDRKYIGGLGRVVSLKNKTFETFADANGFATSLQKRGIQVHPLEKVYPSDMLDLITKFLNSEAK